MLTLSPHGSALVVGLDRMVKPRLLLDAIARGLGGVMARYRVFKLEDNGHVAGQPESIVADNEAEAMREAARLLRDHSLELWDGGRYLTTLTLNPATGHADWIIVAREED